MTVSRLLSSANSPTAFLLRAGLLAGILAIIAGIFGMHVMTGTHAMHTSGGVAAVQGHAGHPAGSHTHHDTGGFQDHGIASASCACSGNCTAMPDMGTTCVPSAKSGSLAAPSPGTTQHAVAVNAGAVGAVGAHYSYLARSPSPGELSISRT